MRLVEANGNDAIERAFLLLPLAAAHAVLGETGRASSLRAEAEALARHFDDETRKAFEQDKEELAAAQVHP